MQQNVQEGREERGKVQTCENLPKSDMVRLRYYHDITGKNSSTYLINKHLSRTPNLITMANTTAPQRQIRTRVSNRTAHPGNADKSRGRRTSVEVQKEHTAKSQAKAAHEEAKQNSINRTAEFKLADIAEEGLADATPCPPFTPKQWPPPRNQTYSDLTPLAAMSDVEMSDDFDRASFVPPRSEMSATVDDSAVESDAPTPPPKKQKIQEKAAVKTAAKTTARKAGGKKHVD